MGSTLVFTNDLNENYSVEGKWCVCGCGCVGVEFQLGGHPLGSLQQDITGKMKLPLASHCLIRLEIISIIPHFDFSRSLYRIQAEDNLCIGDDEKRTTSN